MVAPRLKVPMAANRRTSASFLEGKKMPRRERVKFTAPSATGPKRVSFLEGEEGARRTGVGFMARRAATPRGR